MEGREMKYAQVAIIGGGPAGLAAAIEIARGGGQATVMDENHRPGGQLFKQIHKFFGSHEHQAGVRGYAIGEQLLKETSEMGVDVMLNTSVYGIFDNFKIGYIEQKREQLLQAERIILAAGASENTLALPNGTLPGVMGAGAAQTMINVHRVLPGRKIIMVGSGNVGLIVSYQLLQAGADVVALLEAAPEIGGYGVHASKIRRTGVPILTSHTIKEVVGKCQVEGVIVVELDGSMAQKPGSEQFIEADTVCIAVGLNPLTELAWLAGCEFVYIPVLGGNVPRHDTNMETTVKGLYVAGDISGVEEASSALDEGRLAGIACAESLGLYSSGEARQLKAAVWDRLDSLRTGPFGQKRKDAKDKLISTGEGSVL
jgi:thioredoxin reductase